MVDTISVTEAAVWIPEIWANSALAILRDNVVIAPRVYSDSDVASFTVGDTLHIPYPGTLTEHSKNANTAYTLSQPANSADVQVVLDKHEAVSFIIEDVVRAQANQDLLRNYSEAAAISLATKIETDLLTAMQAESNNTGTYASDLTFTSLLDAWKGMTDNLCPPGQRHIAISTKDIVNLLGDTDIQNWIAFSRGAQVAGDPNNFGAIAGFDTLLASQLITTSAQTPAQTKNVAWRRDGVMLAMRGMPEPPVGAGAVAANVRDDVSGLVLRSLIAYDAQYGGVRVTLEALYGVKILQDAKVLLVKS